MLSNKTAFLCFYKAYPPSSGAASVSFHIARHLGGRKWLVQLSSENCQQKVDETMTVISLKDDCRSKLEKLKGLRFRIKRIADKIDEISPDVVVFEGASWVVYFVLLHRDLRRRGITAPIVYHSHNVEYLLRKEKYGWPIPALTKRAEKYLLTHCELSTAVSDVDASQFESLYGIRPVILPNGVDIDKFDAVSDEAIQKIKEKFRLPDQTVLFMGLVDYRPNSEAIEFLLEKAFPLLLSKCPQAKLVIIGGDVGHKAPWLINPGSIPSDDLPAFVKACDVCVAPIFSGSGTRLKILEYMAAARPVVSTRKGAEGLELDDGKAILYAEEAGEFAGRIGFLLENQKQARQIGSNGYQTVRMQYGWPTILNSFPDLLQNNTKLGEHKVAASA